MAKADFLIAEGRRRERADVLAFLERKAAAATRLGERGDDGGAMLSQRLAAIQASIAAAIHEGEADIG